MPLPLGYRLGNYEITGPLGKGGMGEVYRAKDTKLGRDVAIKVLPAAFAQHPERLARFEREAKVLASLNHPNIATIYAVEESPEGKALVMELVQGDTLQGPVPVETAILYATQIANALEAAHDKGIIHRDLKPANIMLTPEGVIKVLDFGLAAVTQPSVESGDAATAATLTMSPTQAGMILGTAGYMAPEQARGKAVDKRADIWAFGVVFYELITGKRLFQGDDIALTLAAVIMTEPRFEEVPHRVERVLKSCLEKEPKKRLRDIGDVWRLLDEEPKSPEPMLERLSPPSRAGFSVGVAALAGVAVLGLAGLGFVHFREVPPEAQSLRYTVAAPGNFLQSLAISPDGRTLVMAATVGGKQQLWLRAMDALEAQPMPFTEGASYPFWSPDSRYVGFFAQAKLKKIAAGGGPAQTLCDASNGRGGSWGSDDVILFSPNNSVGTVLQRVAAGGGVPVDVTKPAGFQSHPVLLKDGRFLYGKAGLLADQSGIYVAKLDGTEDRRILPDASSPAYARPASDSQTGHILFVRDNTLMALPFDGDAGSVAGDVFPVSTGVGTNANITSNYVAVSVAANGLMVYGAGPGGGANQMSWFDRSGKLLGSLSAPGAVYDPAISPDEKFVVFRRLVGSGSDLWVRDLNRGTETKSTSDLSFNATPFWSPMGDRIVFASNRKSGIYNLYQKPASGSGQEELLLPNTMSNVPYQWSRDGGFIVYYQSEPKNKLDLWVLPVGGAADRKPMAFLQTESNEIFGQLAPDSRWMAFTSDRSGQREVYVRPFPPADGEWTISIAGGEAPRWRGDGRELFFEAADGKMMSVSVKATSGPKPSFEAGAPVALFDAHMARSTAGQAYAYDVTADGQRFLINTVAGSGTGALSAPPLTVVTNWIAAIKK